MILLDFLFNLNRLLALLIKLLQNVVAEGDQRLRFYLQHGFIEQPIILLHEQVNLLKQEDKLADGAIDEDERLYAFFLLLFIHVL